VVGAGNASATLSQLIVDGPVERALDVGTGCGVQALHLAARARDVVATDLNPRAVRLAGISLALSGITDARLEQGFLYEPVKDERFDLFVFNPSLLISTYDSRYT